MLRNKTDIPDHTIPHYKSNKYHSEHLKRIESIGLVLEERTSYITHTFLIKAKKKLTFIFRIIE